MSSSEYRFTDGNLIVLYAIHKGRSVADGGFPDYIKERVKLCLETYGMIIRSRPDKHKTIVMIVGDPPREVEKLKEELVKGGIKEEIIATDSDSRDMAQTISRISDMVKSKPNPPFIYFIGSIWLHDIFRSNVVSKLKGYRVQFYGALDHRSVDEVEKEKALDVPKKSIENYKQHAKNKAVDVLLNIIFPD
jgi:hypothetical protein